MKLILFGYIMNWEHFFTGSSNMFPWEWRPRTVTGCSGLLDRKTCSPCLEREIHMVEMGPFGTIAKHRLNWAERDNWTKTSVTKQLRYWSPSWKDVYCIIIIADCKNSPLHVQLHVTTLHKLNPFFPQWKPFHFHF